MQLRTLALALALSLAGCGPRDPNDGKDTRYNAETVAIMRQSMAADANGIDVGAYIGALTAPMVEIAPRGRHVAVEPQPAYAARLRTKFPTVEVLEMALGDTSGTVEFVLALEAPARSGLRKQEYPKGEEATRMIPVRLARLDDVIPLDRRIAFIKMDVEGAEYMVLRGALKTIKRERPVIVLEFGRVGIKDFGVTPDMMWHMLTDQLGMNVTLMRTWLDRGPALTIDQFKGIVDAGSDWMFIAYPPDRR